MLRLMSLILAVSQQTQNTTWGGKYQLGVRCMVKFKLWAPSQLRLCSRQATLRYCNSTALVSRTLSIRQLLFAKRYPNFERRRPTSAQHQLEWVSQELTGDKSFDWFGLSVACSTLTVQPRNSTACMMSPAGRRDPFAFHPGTTNLFN